MSALGPGGVGAVVVAAVLPLFVFAPLAAGIYQPDPEPRDEWQYLEWAATEYRSHSGEFKHRHKRAEAAWKAEHGAAALAEGDRACAWLAGQPDVPRTDPSGRSTDRVVLARYVRAGDVERSPGFSAEQHEEFARLSWMTLCGDLADDKTSPVSIEED